MHSTSVRAGAIIAIAAVLGSQLLPMVHTLAEDGAPSSYIILNDTFESTDIVQESSAAGTSASSSWWLNSGGLMKQEFGVGKSMQGWLSKWDPIRQAYAKSNPIETDNGAHPQNIFRLYSQKLMLNSEIQATVKINRDNLLNEANRHPWNSIALISRYQSGSTLYYGAIRMDGHAVIKKKINGTYYTLAESPYFAGTYSASSNADLLPKAKPIGLKLKTMTNADGTVALSLLVDENSSGTWRTAAGAVDNAASYGGAVIATAGRSGLWSDFMDIEFDNVVISVPVQVQDLVSTSTAPTSATTTVVITPTATTTSPTPVQIATSASSTTATSTSTTTTSIPVSDPIVVTPVTSTVSTYGLNENTTIQESGSMGASGNQYWWVNSGAYFSVENDIGKTVQGNLPTDDRWRTLYAANNPTDTDNGYHPQNIFRLVTTSTFKNFTQEGYFKINAYNESASPNREGYNGFLFFNRYVDGQNLYYTGLRVDGTAIIKKKLNGTYYTLAQKPVFAGSYDRTTNPNLIPEHTWIGLRSVVTDNTDGSVSIKVYADKSGSGAWMLVAEATDSGANGSVISSKASAGIRTDFMDAEIKDYLIKEF